MTIRRLLPLVPALLYSFGGPPRAAGQSWISAVLDSAAAVRALAQLPPPELPPGVPPFFTLSFDSTGAPAMAEPLFRQIPDAYAAPVAAILRAHARPWPPGNVPHVVRLRVVTGRRAEIGPGMGEATDPALLNGDEIVRLLVGGARAVLGPGEMSAGRRVLVEYRVNDDGGVERDSVRLLMPSGTREMDSVAVAAVRRMRFRPATFAGLPVRYWANQPLTMIDRPSEPSTEPDRVATLDGLTFPVPASYRIVPALGGANLAVFADAGSGNALFVSTLPAGMHRTEAMDHARRAAAAAVWDPRAAEAWIALASYPVSPREAYHDRRMAYYGGQQVVVQLRRLLVGGREIVTGYAFPLDQREKQQELYGAEPRTPSGPAGGASLRIVGALAGETPVDDDSLARDRDAAPAPAGETADPDERAVRAAWAANRSRDRASRMALLARPFLEFLDDVRHLALYAPAAAALHAEPPVNQVYALRLRHLVPAAQLRAMDARQLFGVLSDERPMDFWDYFSQSGSDIAQVSVRGDLAFVWEKRSIMPDVLRREDGVWREDFLHRVFGWESVYRMSIQGFMETNREPPEAAVRTLVGRLTGRPTPASTIWDPSPLPPP